jgi:hypothetical protein
MYNKKANDWVFYTEDYNNLITILSVRNCKAPHRTKDFDNTGKLLKNPNVYRAGYILKDTLMESYNISDISNPRKL